MSYLTFLLWFVMMHHMKHFSFSHVVLYSGVAVSLFALSGCSKLPGKAQTGEQTQNTGEKSITEQDFANISDPQVRKFMVAQAKQTAFRLRTTSSGKGEGTNVMEIETKGTDMGMHSYEEMDGKKLREMIILGDTTYIKDQKDGKWWKQTTKTSPASPGTSDETQLSKVDFKEYLKNMPAVEYKQLGTESCGTAASQLTCYKYQEIDPNNKEAMRYFWFDNKDYVLRKDEHTFGEFTSTTQYSYDNVKVDAPSPTKDVPEGQSIYMYLTDTGSAPVPQKPQAVPVSGKTPSQADIQQMIEEAQKAQE